MPNLDFSLPHWLYWSVVLLFPLVLMYFHKQSKVKAKSKPIKREANIALAYLFLLTGGLFGIHRLYLNNRWGLLYLPLVGFIMFSNLQYNKLREDVSRLTSEVMIAEDDASDLKKIEAPTEEDKSKLGKAEEKVGALQVELKGFQDSLTTWKSRAGWMGLFILLWLLLDAYLLPGMLRKCKENEALDTREDMDLEQLVAKATAHTTPTSTAHSRLTDRLDSVSDFVGVYISYWTTLAVFIYYYEVLSRYFFNSPTNWAHEGAFLMLGMQYLLSGNFGFKENALVSVDVIYNHLSRRTQAILDISSSFFFFLFTGALLVTGWLFFVDAYVQQEVTMNEWLIKYWPIKSTIVIGSLLLILQ
ncbi:MAG: TRAP transporter small permease subunit, partial [Deltaproteobacteria bacterium]|nr:TRAP transporter small permease subunit [Deltaproteobacteria bacterium]